MPAKDDDVDIPPMVDALIESTKKNGPMVLEVWICNKCNFEAFCFHHFCETLTCGNCGHALGSRVPRYLSVLEKFVDEK